MLQEDSILKCAEEKTMCIEDNVLHKEAPEIGKREFDGFQIEFCYVVDDQTFFTLII